MKTTTYIIYRETDGEKKYYHTDKRLTSDFTRHIEDAEQFGDLDKLLIVSNDLVSRDGLECKICTIQTTYNF